MTKPKTAVQTQLACLHIPWQPVYNQSKATYNCVRANNRLWWLVRGTGRAYFRLRNSARLRALKFPINILADVLAFKYSQTNGFGGWYDVTGKTTFLTGAATTSTES